MLRLGILFQDEPAGVKIHVDAVGPEQGIAQETRSIPAGDRIQLFHREFVHGLPVEDEGTEGDR